MAESAIEFASESGAGKEPRGFADTGFMTQAQELERQYRKGLITGEEYDAALLALATPEERKQAEARVDAAMEAKTLTHPAGKPAAIL
jgi:hypothetical protein